MFLVCAVNAVPENDSDRSNIVFSVNFVNFKSFSASIDKFRKAWATFSLVKYMYTSSMKGI